MKEKRPNLRVVENISREQELLWVGDVTQPTREVVINVVAQRLLTDWFPKAVPVDIEKWREIAKADAERIVDELIAHDLLKYVKEEEQV